MENEVTVGDAEDASDDNEVVGAAIIEEWLIEEISIDGMCGVY